MFPWAVEPVTNLETSMHWTRVVRLANQGPGAVLGKGPLKLVKVRSLKVHTLDIAPLRSESPLQKRSGTAGVLKHRCKRRFFTFFIQGTFLRFLTFFILPTFFIFKNVH